MSHVLPHLRPGREEKLSMPDPFDVALSDDELLTEVELTTNLIVAATASDERLSTEEIDQILGVTPKK